MSPRHLKIQESLFFTGNKSCYDELQAAGNGIV